MSPEAYTMKPVKNGREDVNDVYDTDTIKIKKVNKKRIHMKEIFLLMNWFKICGR
jgi:hypothetical protein